MNLDFFKKTRILDGGMGQELLARGLVSKGTLWSASAILEKKFHNLVLDLHLSYINSGADVIITNTFSARRIRLIQNKVNEHFKYINEQACLLAIKAKDISIQQVAMDTVDKGKKEWVAVVNLNSLDDNSYLQHELPRCMSSNYLIGTNINVKAYIDNNNMVVSRLFRDQDLCLQGAP